ncbi:hypothetical protein QN362_18350 [Actimicrobium sp. CCC2.4]|uniref:hypothetical protein n=1 Tax=Actimicrobium sp. CCC2.4 TaxID=3048606 RepID=UPI002AC99DB7|nr:hypothetical protein [Actimicrobium sp. CCC2.4]MEB0137297.1 hypothetical protein [Actimicrobium sp. CCC2.4]WPX32521.1 hypothetical protein RHM62_01335 [Actimicrobium sp. CCC2.4]
MRRPAEILQGGLLAALLLMAAPLAWSHGGGNEDVIVTIDAVPAALGKMRVELRKTLAPQLVLENTSGIPVEVVGSDGIAFLRLGPAGAEANINAPDWYRFYSTSGTPLPERLTKLKKGERLPEDWQAVSRSPAWGWFDARLDTESLKVPHKARDSALPVAFKSWKIPLRLAGRTQFLSGHFQTMPAVSGHAEARLTSAPELAPGVLLQVLQGPVPAFMLANDSHEPVRILDADGIPLLEIGPAGVRVNTRSSGWIGSGLAESGFAPMPVAAGDGPLWLIRSSTPRFTWLDPRAAMPLAAGKRRPTSWTIPYVRQASGGDITGKVQGTTQWISNRQMLPAGGTS